MMSVVAHVVIHPKSICSEEEAVRTLAIVSALSLCLIVAGCGDDTDSPAAVPDPNTGPVADAGPDQAVDVGDPVVLDGSASSDADQDALTYAWTLAARPDGSVAVLAGPNTAQPGFTADLEGDYVAQLIVNDGELDSAPDTVTVTAEAPAGPAWSALERMVAEGDVPDAVEALSYPVPVRFDANTIHLYFSGVAYKTWAVVPAYVYRMISTDDGDTWSAPERMAQLEGNYQSYVVGHVEGQLLLIWHDGFHAEIHKTALPTEDTVPAVPTLYLDHATAGMEVIRFTLWNQTMIGMWHPANQADYRPFVGTAGAATATLSALTSPYQGDFTQATLIEPDRAIVLLNDNSLLLADFDGTSLATTGDLAFPAADASLNYGGDTFYYAQFDQASGDLYFTGFSQDRNDSAIYRVQLAD